jgi:hypothetical protein
VAAVAASDIPQDDAAQLRAQLRAARAERDEAVRKAELAQQRTSEAVRKAELGQQRTSEALRKAELAHLRTFEALLQGMSGTGSESSSGGDAARRGAPLPVLEEGLLARWPEPAPAAVQAAWSGLRVRLAHSSPAAGAATGSFEVRCVHPPVRDALLAAMSSGACGLRLWSGVVAADSNLRNAMKADFSLSHLRDRLSSLLGAAVLVEVKPPGELEDAITQALNYARRRMRELFAAAQLRGDVPLHALEVFAVATDGLEVVLLRVTSGAPELGSYENAVPCPSYKSPRMPLLSGWDFVTAAGNLPQAPPAGFVALVRLLCADADALVGTAMPLTSVVADLSADAAAPAESAVELRLGTRLGCGGSSDAYAVATDAPHAGAGAVLKLARGATDRLVRAFEAEEVALRLLAGAPGVPCLLRAGRRAGWPHSMLGNADVRWPLLLLSPLGTPLDTELAARLGAAGAAGAPLAGVRRAFADEVLSGVHAALRAAHDAGLVHCDVRPSNCVVAAGVPLLVDWGLARGVGADASGCGDALFALDAVFLQDSYIARPWQDLASAALLWVAIAYGPGADCDAPWRMCSSVSRTMATRGAWLRAAAPGDAALRAVLERLERASTRRAVTTAADYEWLPPRSR